MNVAIRRSALDAVIAVAITLAAVLFSAMPAYADCQLGPASSSDTSGNNLEVYCEPGPGQRTAPVFQGIWYGAIAKDTAGNWGASWHRKSQADANSAALEYCRGKGHKGCKIVAGAANDCMALAESTDGSWGVDYSNLDRTNAIRKATDICSKYGGHGCRAVASVCGRQAANSRPCLEVSPGHDMSRGTAWATLPPDIRERFAHPERYTNGACQ